jgi:hypothetical protein
MPKLDFFNTDFELSFRREPKLLLESLGERVFVLYSGEHPKGHFVSLELHPYVKDPVKSLRRWLRFLKSLPPATQRELHQAKNRVFDLGFGIAAHPQMSQIELPKDLLAEIAQWKASYVVTLYAAGPTTSPALSRTKRRQKPKAR